MDWTEGSHNGLSFAVRTLEKQGVGGGYVHIFGFTGFVFAHWGSLHDHHRIPVQCLAEEGYRREDWAREAAIDEAKAIIDGQRPLKDPSFLRTQSD
ncbi:hypothetical protein BH160DRAFT_0076 [Burkholderia sp. H160]|nr:hypothetical protein BH160DRAFT_0076 [Burkholderia sp. H160]